MAGLQLSGLASGFDWKTFTDSVMEMERAPARRYQAEQAKNDNKKSQLSSLGTKLSSLQTAMSALSSSSLGAGRKVVNDSSSAVVKATVSSATPVGTYEVEVVSKATASRMTSGAVSSPTAAGSLTINGTDIAITANQTVASVISAINNSDAGVTAIYSATAAIGAGCIVLTNRDTGDTALTVSSKNAVGATDSAIATSLGLTTEAVTGSQAVFEVNGLRFTSANNTFDSTDHGIAGLSLKADTAMTSAETLTVSADSSGMRSKIDAFVSSFNSVADFIESTTSYTTTAGKTTAGPLADNREIQAWLRQLRTTAFGSPAYGEIPNLSALGLNFSSTNSRITVTDSTILDTALTDHASDVAKFFNNTATGSTGLATAFVTKLDAYIGTDGTAGKLNTKLETYTKANASLDKQIANLDRYLVQRRSQLEAGFMAMESAQSKMTQMQTQLTNSFGKK